MEVNNKTTWSIALLTILVIGFVFYAVNRTTQQKKAMDKAFNESFSPAISLKSDEEEGILHMSEISPMFPGCDSLSADLEAQKICSEEKLLQYLYSKISYPEYALQHDIEGRCVITFVVEKDGTVSHAKILKDIGGGCGEEALRVVNSMNELPKKWIPGKHEGQTARVRFNLPVKFQLATKTEK